MWRALAGMTPAVWARAIAGARTAESPGDAVVGTDRELTFPSQVANSAGSIALSNSAMPFSDLGRMISNTTGVPAYFISRIWPAGVSP